jgi:hypothetical protein
MIGLLMAGMFISTLVLLLTGQTFPTADVYGDYSGTINGTTTDFPIESTINVIYGSLTSFLVLIGIIGGIALVASILIIGSGLTETGSTIAYQLVWFTALWIMLSLLPAPYLFIAGLWGVAFYFGITFFYVYNVISILGKSDTS